MRSDTELVEAASAGDASAWDELVDRYGQLVFANARAVGADWTLAQDVGQVAWMMLLSRLSTIREPSKVKGWLAIVARNEARSALRARRPMADVDDLLTLPGDESDQPEADVFAREDADSVRRALGSISDKCRELLLLLFSAEMSYDEISGALGMPIGSIGPTRQRCVAALARELRIEMRS
ncbi:MAG: sigma-70 family RNA polymerase sigma factor [Actinomycetota bacterium]